MAENGLTSGLSGGNKAFKTRGSFSVAHSSNDIAMGYRSIRCSEEESMFDNTKTYSIGLAAEQVPVVDEFVLNRLDNLQIIEEENQILNPKKYDRIQDSSGRKAMSDWLAKYGELKGNIPSNNGLTSEGTIGLSKPLTLPGQHFSQLVQQAASHTKTNSKTVLSDKTVIGTQNGKKSQQKEDGRNQSLQGSALASSKFQPSQQFKKTVRSRKLVKKTEQAEGKRIVKDAT